MSDLLPALIGMVLLTAFTGWLAVAIGEPALLLVTGAVLLMAAYDFWRELRRG